MSDGAEALAHEIEARLAALDDEDRERFARLTCLLLRAADNDADTDVAIVVREKSIIKVMGMGTDSHARYQLVHTAHTVMGEMFAREGYLN